MAYITNSKGKSVCVCDKPADLERLHKSFGGTIVAVSFSSIEIEPEYHEESYTLDNVGYDVFGQRAYTLETPSRHNTWGLIDFNDNLYHSL